MILGKGERKQKKPKKRIETLRKKEKFFLIESRVQEGSVCRKGTTVYPCSLFHHWRPLCCMHRTQLSSFVHEEPSSLKPTHYVWELELFHICPLAFSLWSPDKCGIFRVSAIIFPGSGFTVVI